MLNNSASPKLTASTAMPAIVRATPNAAAITYTWTAADFGYQAAINYTLQFAKAGTNFATTVSFDLGQGLTKSFTSAELNKVYNDLDCNLSSTPTPLALEARVRASVGDAAAASGSEVRNLLATPYPEVTLPAVPDEWGIVGPAADGWPGATPTDRKMTYDCRVRGYVLTTALKAGPFKFRRKQDWGENLGGVTGDYTKGVKLITGGPDMTITTPGTYLIILSVDYNASGATTSGSVVIK